jgi:hypothetical protein
MIGPGHAGPVRIPKNPSLVRSAGGTTALPGAAIEVTAKRVQRLYFLCRTARILLEGNNRSHSS